MLEELLQSPARSRSAAPFAATCRRVTP